MGADMCKDEYYHDLLIDGEPDFYGFSPGSWPNDPYLMKLIRQSKVSPNQQKNKPLCNPFRQRYYWCPWVSGKPLGKGIYFINQPQKKLYYQGDINGHPNGAGRLIFNEGDWEYEGEVLNGKAHGKGKMINRKQGYTFDGVWEQSKPSKGQLIFFKNKAIKQGKVSPKDGNTLIDLDISRRQNTIYYPDGRVYVGQINFKNFTPHGIGKVTIPDKSQYIGEWEMGKMHGLGKFLWSDGSCYSGDYTFGKRSGKGKFVFNNGNYYVGGWYEGKQHSQGTLYDKQGKVIQKGLWKQGVIFKK